MVVVGGGCIVQKPEQLLLCGACQYYTFSSGCQCSDSIINYINVYRSLYYAFALCLKIFDIYHASVFLKKNDNSANLNLKV